jgi:hypothetical protein
MGEDGEEGWLLRGGLKRRLDENFDVFVMSKHRSKAYFIIRVKSPFVWTRGVLRTQRMQETQRSGSGRQRSARAFSRSWKECGGHTPSDYVPSPQLMVLRDKLFTDFIFFPRLSPFRAEADFFFAAIVFLLIFE